MGSGPSGSLHRAPTDFTRPDSKCEPVNRVFDLQRITQQAQLQHIEYHESLDSTNKLAARLAEQLRAVCPALVLTASQTAGRGRGSNSWQATEGALTFSVVYDREAIGLSPQRLPQLSLAAGLAVRQVLAERTDRPCLVKWPNDVLVSEQKICGILTEQHHTGGGEIIVVGIGINVNNSLVATAADFRTSATSLYDATGQLFDLSDTLIATVNQLNASIRLLSDRPREFFAKLNRFSQLNGRDVEIDDGTRTITGRCLGVDEDGRLLLDQGGAHARVIAGTVVRW